MLDSVGQYLGKVLGNPFDQSLEISQQAGVYLMLTCLSAGQIATG
jgi:hypothetical protein